MIDLHIHTNHSDASASVSEVLRLAEQAGVSHISLADHNTVSAYQELKVPEIRRLFSGNILTGAEFNTSYRGEIIEILGYGFDLNKMRASISEHYMTFEEKQKQEFGIMCQKYRALGMRFEEKNIVFDPKNETCRHSFCKELLRYPENHRFFLDTKHSSRKDFARQEVFNPKSPLFIDPGKMYPDLGTVLQIIHDAGGLAFLAHTYVYSPDILNSLEDIVSEYPLDGLECFYTSFTPEQSDRLVAFCKAHGLYKSGGSDFHGSAVRPGWEIGTGTGDLKVSLRDVTWYKGDNYV